METIGQNFKNNPVIQERNDKWVKKAINNPEFADKLLDACEKRPKLFEQIIDSTINNPKFATILLDACEKRPKLFEQMIGSISNNESIWQRPTKTVDFLERVYRHLKSASSAKGDEFIAEYERRKALRSKLKIQIPTKALDELAKESIKNNNKALTEKLLYIFNNDRNIANQTIKYAETSKYISKEQLNSLKEVDRLALEGAEAVKEQLEGYKKTQATMEEQLKKIEEQREKQKKEGIEEMLKRAQKDKIPIIPLNASARLAIETYLQSQSASISVNNSHHQIKKRNINNNNKILYNTNTLNNYGKEII